MIKTLTQHLSPHATPEDIKDFLEHSSFKIPFYDTPRKVDVAWRIIRICANLDSPERQTLTLAFLPNPNHAPQDKELFIENSLLNPQMIEFIHETPEVMEQMRPESRTIVQERAHFLGSLKTLSPQAVMKFVKDQVNKDLKALGYFFISTNPEITSNDKFEAANILSLGQIYQYQASEAFLSIATNPEIDSYYRLNAAKILANRGKTYKPQVAQTFLSIATNPQVDSELRLIAAEILAKLGENYKEQTAQAYFSIATDMGVNSDDRIDAADNLARLGKLYKSQAIEAYHSILATELSEEWRQDIEKALADLEQGS